MEIGGGIIQIQRKITDFSQIRYHFYPFYHSIFDFVCVVCSGFEIELSFLTHSQVNENVDFVHAAARKCHLIDWWLNKFESQEVNKNTYFTV